MSYNYWKSHLALPYNSRPTNSGIVRSIDLEGTLETRVESELTSTARAPKSARERAQTKEKLEQNTQDVPPGTVIYDEGDAGEACFLLLSGKVAVTKGGKPVAVFDKPMSYFGELAALLAQPHRERARAETDCKLMRIPGDRMDAMMDLSPAIGKKLIKSLAQRMGSLMQAYQNKEEQHRQQQQQALADQMQQVTDYKRLVLLLELVYEDRKFPQLKELHDYARAASQQFSLGGKVRMDMAYLKRFAYLEKLVFQSEGQPAST